MKTRKNDFIEKYAPKLALELHRAGLDIYAISKETGLPLSEVEALLGLDESTPPEQYDATAHPVTQNNLAILELLGKGISVQQWVSDDKQRLLRYSEIEEKCLNLMARLVDSYSEIPEGDLKVDAFKARLANDFLRATQEVRNELLLRFSPKQGSDANSDKVIDVEFV